MCFILGRNFPRKLLQAKKEADKVPDLRIMVGAVITNKGRVVSVGRNKNKSHPLFANGSNGIYTIHAEVAAILAAKRKCLRGAKIWVYRETRDGKPALARPCKEVCLPLILECGIKEIIYTVSSPPYYRRMIL